MKNTLLLMLLVIATSIFGQNAQKHPKMEDEVTFEEKSGQKIITIFYDGEQDTSFLHTVVQQSVGSYNYSKIGEKYAIELKPKIYVQVQKKQYYYKGFLKPIGTITIRFKNTENSNGILGNPDAFAIYIAIHQYIWFFENKLK